MNYGQQNNQKQVNYPYQMGRGKQDHQHNLQNIQQHPSFFSDASSIPQIHSNEYE